MIILLLSIITFFSAIAAIIFRVRNELKIFAILKPFTTILIIGIAIMVSLSHETIYGFSIIFSLVFALIGDIFLLSKKHNNFLYGLLSFSIAHIGFTYAFVSINGFNWNIALLIVLLSTGGLYFMFIRKHLSKMSIPVGFYIVIIVIMNWQAVGLFLMDSNFYFLAIALASLLFSFSDSIIAYNYFKKPFKIAEILILSTYWIAIYVFTIMGLFVL